VSEARPRSPSSQSVMDLDLGWEGGSGGCMAGWLVGSPSGEVGGCVGGRGMEREREKRKQMEDRQSKKGREPEEREIRRMP